MSRRYKIRDNDRVYFITITTVGWVDLFTRLNHKNILIDSLEYCQKKKGLEIYSFCIMPSHLHMICGASEGKDLTSIIRDFKKFTSKQLLKAVKEEPESRRAWLLEMFSKACAHLNRPQKYKIWQDGYHGEELISERFVGQKLNYIHMNPVKDGWVQHPEDYLYSSARNYAGLDGVLDVEVLPVKAKVVV